MKGVKSEIRKETSQYQNQKLIEAIIEVESNFNPYAISLKDARGLMQVRPVAWHRKLVKEGIIKKEADYFDIRRNVEAGDFVLTELTRIYKGDLKKILNHYSGGAKGYYEKVVKRMNRDRRPK